jgi:hypothetical protein
MHIAAVYLLKDVARRGSLWFEGKTRCMLQLRGIFKVIRYTT